MSRVGSKRRGEVGRGLSGSRNSLDRNLIHATCCLKCENARDEGRPCTSNGVGEVGKIMGERGRGGGWIRAGQGQVKPGIQRTRSNWKILCSAECATVVGRAVVIDR